VRWARSTVARRVGLDKVGPPRLCSLTKHTISHAFRAGARIRRGRLPLTVSSLARTWEGHGKRVGGNSAGGTRAADWATFAALVRGPVSRVLDRFRLLDGGFRASILLSAPKGCYSLATGEHARKPVRWSLKTALPATQSAATCSTARPRTSLGLRQPASPGRPSRGPAAMAAARCRRRASRSLAASDRAKVARTHRAAPCQHSDGRNAWSREKFGSSSPPPAVAVFPRRQLGVTRKGRRPAKDSYGDGQRAWASTGPHAMMGLRSTFGGKLSTAARGRGQIRNTFLLPKRAILQAGIEGAAGCGGAPIPELPQLTKTRPRCSTTRRATTLGRSGSRPT